MRVRVRVRVRVNPKPNPDPDPNIGTAASWTSRLALLAISGEAGGLPPFEMLDKPLGKLWFA